MKYFCCFYDITFYKFGLIKNNTAYPKCRLNNQFNTVNKMYTQTAYG